MSNAVISEDQLIPGYATADEITVSIYCKYCFIESWQLLANILDESNVFQKVFAMKSFLIFAFYFQYFYKITEL